MFMCKSQITVADFQCIENCIDHETWTNAFWEGMLNPQCWKDFLFAMRTFWDKLTRASIWQLYETIWLLFRSYLMRRYLRHSLRKARQLLIRDICDHVILFVASRVHLWNCSYHKKCLTFKDFIFSIPDAQIWRCQRNLANFLMPLRKLSWVKLNLKRSLFGDAVSKILGAVMFKNLQLWTFEITNLQFCERFIPKNPTGH